MPSSKVMNVLRESLIESIFKVVIAVSHILKNTVYITSNLYLYNIYMDRNK